MPEMRIPEGLMLKRNNLEIDMSIYQVKQADNTLLLFKKKKKKPKLELGITCSCSEGQGNCGISFSPDASARCTGAYCCGWVLIEGEELEKFDTFDTF